MKREQNVLKPKNQSAFTHIILYFIRLFYSQVRLESLVQTSNDAIVVLSDKFIFTQWNKSAEKLFGYTREEIIGKPVGVIIPPHLTSQMAKVIRQGRKNKVINFETQRLKKDKTLIDVAITYSPILYKNKIIAYSVTYRDITQNKKIENEFELHSVILKNIHEGVCLVRVEDEVIVYANPKFERMLGYKRGELNNKPVIAINYGNPEEARERTEKITKKLHKYGSLSYEVKNKKKDGTPIWCKANTTEFVHVKYGKVWVALQRDITHEKKLLDALQEKEELFRQAIQHFPHIFAIFNPDAKILFTNTMASKITGVKRKQFIGKSIGELFPPEVSTQVEPLLRQAIAKRKTQTSEATVFFRQ